MPATYFGFDVAVLNAGTGHDFLRIFQDCEVTLDTETANARAAHDLADPTINGFDCDVLKSRGWGLRLGAAVESTTAGDIPCRRAFGWGMGTLMVGSVDVIERFQTARVRVSNETIEARATGDTNDSVIQGWRYPQIGHRSLEIEIDAVLAPSALFDLALGAWGTGSVVTYSLSGAGILVSGNAIVAGSSIRHGMEAGVETIRLRAHGAPSTTPTITPTSAPDPGNLMLMSLSNGTFPIQISHPNSATAPFNPNAIYAGDAILTDATFEAPDGASVQNGTFLGVGKLAAQTLP